MSQPVPCVEVDKSGNASESAKCADKSEFDIHVRLKKRGGEQ